jgi:lipopolysaccharide transport system ATP-binding protein
MPTAPGGWLDALRDVSFEIQQGEAVGLIGRNGAGKSTLLRILSRVTRPSDGYADVAGTVGALLEVGTGFHPELTGRENAFLSGAILGLSKREVQARFDEMVAFAQIEPFIDTPVKRYSSGMYARLGFAVAAHLRPHILIVDEVLAVGDLAFQAKCLAHMHRLTDDGTTVLFVSHNLLAVADLCSRGLLLHSGSIVADEPVDRAIKSYRRIFDDPSVGAGSAAGLGLRVIGVSPSPDVVLSPGDDLSVEVDVLDPYDGPAIAVTLNFLIDRSDGRPAIHLRSDLTGPHLVLAPGANSFALSIHELPLAPGAYQMWVRLTGLDGRDPVILDSDRVEMMVLGDQRLDGIALPRHSFSQTAAGVLARVGAA